MDFDIVISHGPSCRDGLCSMYVVWSTLSDEQKDQYKELYGKFEGKINEIDPEDTLFKQIKKIKETPFVPKENFDRPSWTSPEGAMILLEKGVKPVFVLVQPGEHIPSELVKDKRVLVLDIAMEGYLEMEEVIEKRDKGFVTYQRPGSTVLKGVTEVLLHASQTVWIDHHDSTKSVLPLVENLDLKVVYEPDKTLESGCTLTWKYFYDTDLPPLFELVRVGDTWDWSSNKLKQFGQDFNAKKFLDYVYYKKYLSGMKLIDKAVKGGMELIQKWNEEMKSDSLFQNKQLSDLLVHKSTAKKLSIGKVVSDDKEYVVAYAYMCSHVSGMGMLMRKYARKYYNIDPDFTICWFYIPEENKVVCSLRDGTNLHNIASNIEGVESGGGHSSAAGFSFVGIENFHNIIRK